MVHIIALPPELISEICHDLESWIPFLQSSPEVLMTYKTIFIDYPVISDLHFVSSIFSLRADMTAAPLRLILHRVVIRNFLQAMDIAPCSIFDTVVMYRCVYNEDDLRMLFTCFRNVQFGDQFSCQSQTWLEDLSHASCHLEYLHIAFKAVDVGIVVDLLSAARGTLSTLCLKVMEGRPSLDVSQCGKLSTLSVEVLMTDLAFISRLLGHGTSNLDSLVWGIICNNRNYDLRPDVEIWREWFKHASPLRSTII
ncbi:hypothetical protein EV421DRAFT_1738369 [Armillaria borealis]|uniref:Uncharacterized protein n=1 Tax=Armillaria borealis TaxID=47425 RepID=A0AA39JDI0_9AGAR|nr:hypothetical protein EV421DRAFT_1738369 [Armillaria borealis]